MSLTLQRLLFFAKKQSQKKGGMRHSAPSMYTPGNENNLIQQINYRFESAENSLFVK